MSFYKISQKAMYVEHLQPLRLLKFAEGSADCRSSDDA